MEVNTGSGLLLGAFAEAEKYIMYHNIVNGGPDVNMVADVLKNGKGYIKTLGWKYSKDGKTWYDTFYVDSDFISYLQKNNLTLYNKANAIAKASTSINDLLSTIDISKAFLSSTSNTNVMATETGTAWYDRVLGSKKVTTMSATGQMIYWTDELGSHSSGAGSDARANEIVARWKQVTGQAGTSNPIDPLSISASNLVKATAAGTTTSALTTQVDNTATSTGLPKWIIWLVILGGGYFLLRWLWRLFKKRR